MKCPACRPGRKCAECRDWQPSPEYIAAECAKIRAENGHTPALDCNVRESVIEELLSFIENSDWDEEPEE